MRDGALLFTVQRCLVLGDCTLEFASLSSKLLVISEYDPYQLEANVKEKISEGFEPLGPPVFDQKRKYWCQAMAKYEKSDVPATPQGDPKPPLHFGGSGGRKVNLG